MKTVTSPDGTKIAFDQLGAGPPLIMLAGAFNDRSTTSPLAEAMQDQFTVLNYDRRGRGESGDTTPYAVEREIEDLAALIAELGGASCVFGYSSGATLALRAAASSLPITRLALYEPPFLVDDSRPAPPADLAEQLATLISLDRRGDAVELYQLQGIGLPQPVVAQIREAPFRPSLEAIAHTLVYDATITGDLSLPDAALSSVTAPTLVLSGGNSWGFLQSGADAAGALLPNGRHLTLAGQTHDIDPAAVAPVLRDFFADGSTAQ
jgi:pimeloyl-ACP methyl ester carboxylesterase